MPIRHDNPEKGVSQDSNLHPPKFTFHQAATSISPPLTYEWQSRARPCFPRQQRRSSGQRERPTSGRRLKTYCRLKWHLGCCWNDNRVDADMTKLGLADMTNQVVAESRTFYIPLLFSPPARCPVGHGISAVTIWGFSILTVSDQTQMSKTGKPSKRNPMFHKICFYDVSPFRIL